MLLDLEFSKLNKKILNIKIIKIWVLYKKNQNLKNIIPRESSQVPEPMCCIVPFIVNVQKWQIFRGKAD